MATKKEKEDQLLLDNGFQPENLSDQDREEALALLAQENPPSDQQDSEESSPGRMTYWRSKVAALSILLGKPASGQVEPPRVRFSPFQEKEDGEHIKVGYLATDDPRAIERLKQDGNVQKITKAEYEDATDTTNPKVKPLPL